MASSTSKELLLGIAVLVQRVHGSIASVFPGRPERDHVIEGRTVHAQQEWGLSFCIPGEGHHRARQFVCDDGAWKRVRSVEDAGDIEMWNLRVAEDESYTAEGCIVKNCPMPFDLADRLIERYTMAGETVYDPFGGLFTVPYCAVKLGRVAVSSELSEHYFRDGVVYVRAAAAEVAAPTLFDLLGDDAA